MVLARFAVWMLSAGAVIFGSAGVSGQDYPSKPIRILTSGVGGGNDLVSRLLAQGIAGPLGQSVIVENRPTGIIAAEVVSKAPPDGYSLLFASASLWIGPLIQKMPYDPFRDFSPITLTDRQPHILVVHPSLPVKSVKELIALAKARPGELNYATSNIGSTNHLGAELFKSMAGVNIVRITYKSAVNGLNEVMGGQVQLMFATAAPAVAPVKSGRLRALAVTSAQPSVMFPGLSTVAAAGLPGYEAESPDAVFAPANTPALVIGRLNQEIVRVLNRADVKEKFLVLGLEPVGSSPEELAAVMKSDLTKMGKLIKDVGARAD